MRRAIIPGKLVPPPIWRRRPDAPANLPADIAIARRARLNPLGADGRWLLTGSAVILSVGILFYFRLVFDNRFLYFNIAVVLLRSKTACSIAKYEYVRQAS
jgi:hypothetical protein